MRNIKTAKKPFYLKFFKPYGVLCSFTDPEDRPNLSQYIQQPDVYSAGRLDMDSEGLLILTNDGEINHRITSPQHYLQKIYYVLVEGSLTTENLDLLSSGPIIKGNYKTRSCIVEKIPDPLLPEREKPITPHGPVNWLKIILNEGKKRQIRHMTAAVGLPTLRLVRVAIGPIKITGLQPGEWEYISETELAGLKKDLRM
jgi:23S rRNA pseudouridine2457 synthase